MKENLEYFEEEMGSLLDNQKSYQDYEFIRPNVKLVAYQPCEVKKFN
jgi:hypothetical protein